MVIIMPSLLLDNDIIDNNSDFNQNEKNINIIIKLLIQHSNINGDCVKILYAKTYLLYEDNAVVR